MKLKAVCLVFFFAASLFAQNARQNDNRTEITFEDGKKAVVISAIEITEELTQKISNAVFAAWQIPGLDGNSASVLVDSSGSFRFVLYPTQFVYQGADLIHALPSGMAFYYTTTLFYDITMKVDEYAPKVTGLFVSAEDLLKNLYAATIMPDMYMFDSYLLKRVARLEQALMAQSKKSLFSRPKSVNEQIILAIRGYYNENPEISKKDVEARLKQDGIKAAKSDIDAVFMVLLGRIE